jgi:hypothetical protein
MICPEVSDVTRTYDASGQLESVVLGGADLMSRDYNYREMISSVYDSGVSESQIYSVDNTPDNITQ